jgi:hypothetical protein
LGGGEEGRRGVSPLRGERYESDFLRWPTQGVPLCSLGDVACSREELSSGLVCITGAEIQLQLISVDEFIVEKNETTLTIDGGGLIEKDSSVIAQMLALNIFEGHRISPHTVETQNHRHLANPMVRYV